jgi:hypothetical protein
MGAIEHEAAAGRLRSAFGAGGLLAVLIAVAAFLVVSAVVAVHNKSDFELEGDIADGAAAGPDWGSIFHANGDVADIDGGIAAGFIADDISPASANDDTVFTAGGTKNNQQPSEDWLWGTQSVPAKDDLSNVYAFGTLNAAGHLILYAGVERLAPEGASHIDIEFNSEAIALDEEPACDNEPCAFLGDKITGDLLVAMEFGNGGALGELRVYQWNGANYVQVSGAFVTGGGCNAQNGIAADSVCSFNNGGGVNGGPWVNYDRHGAEITDLEENAFTEFGVDVTAILHGQTPCITSFMAHTRTSPGPPQDDPITSELKDFAAPTPLPLCGLLWEKQDGGGALLDGANLLALPHSRWPGQRDRS